MTVMTGDQLAGLAKDLSDALDQPRDWNTENAVRGIHPEGRVEREYTHIAGTTQASESHVLVVPVSTKAGTSQARAAEFYRVFQGLARGFGRPPTLMGSHREQAPYGRVEVGWGTPFARWHHRSGQIELRAAGEGLVVVCDRGSAWQTWYDLEVELSLLGMTGWLAARNEAPPRVDLSPFQHGFAPFTWPHVHQQLAALVEPLPAETTALGLPLDWPFFLTMPGTNGPLTFEIHCHHRLNVSYTEPAQLPAAPRGADAAALGWRPCDTATADIPDEDARDRPAWRVDAGGPGEVDGAVVADLIVTTAQAAGAHPSDLVLAGEALSRPGYDLGIPALHLSVG